MTTVAFQQALSMPTADVGEVLLELVEDQWFDRKSTRTPASKLANVLIGMANADGGAVVIGLWDGKVEGTDRAPQRRNEQMQAAMDFASPPIRCRSRLLGCVNQKEKKDHLLVLEVEPSAGMHSNQKDEVYLRVGDETRKLTFDQRQELMFDKGEASFEARPITGTSLRDVADTVLDSYAEAVMHPSKKRLMKARGLVTQSGELTVAGLLLFARTPQTHLPEAYVRVLRYRGTSRGAGSRQQLLSDEKIEGPIALQLIEARNVIKSVQPSRRALVESGRFADVPLIPEDAWLEGLVNAVVHRSYSLTGDHIRVEAFDDRVEITSPGRFPGVVDASDPMEVTRFARNPRIARVCADQHFGQELGEGIRRIFEEMRAAGFVDPDYRQTSGSVALTLSTELADRALEARLPPDSRKITAALRETERMSTGEVAELLQMSRPAAIRRLNALKEAGLIEWHGKGANDPRAYWALRVD